MLRTSEPASLLVEVLPANGEAMGLVCAKGRMRQNYRCTNMQFEQALCLAAASGKIKRVFGGEILARAIPQQHTFDAGKHRKYPLAAWLPDLLGRAARSMSRSRTAARQGRGT